MYLIRDHEVNGKIHLKLSVLICAIVIDSFVLNAQDARNCSYKSYKSNPINQRAELLEDKGQLISIPIVVHVVYSNAQQNISDEQITSQLKVLNEDFTRNNPDTINTLAVFKKNAGNAKINFFLAVHDEFGNPTNGITRTPSTHAPFANDDIHNKDKGGKNAWPTNNYLNVWICDLADGVFGFSSPIGSDPSIEGVVVDYLFFGTIGLVSAPFNKGRTATHEIGHWMGLKHLWGNAGGCTDDDGITDTPPQIGPSSGCNLTRTSCGGLNMVQNFMDNSADECMSLFSKGQIAEMRKNLFSFRSEIIQDGIVTSITDQSPSGMELIQIKSEIFLIKSEYPIELIFVYNLFGQEVSFLLDQSDKGKITLDLSGLGGFYILTAISSNHRLTKKILLQ
ncbi:MAG: M43 family zinc metalloprotease [Cyclobacteriaceae bacterium]